MHTNLYMHYFNYMEKIFYLPKSNKYFIVQLNITFFLNKKSNILNIFMCLSKIVTFCITPY